MAKTVLTVKKFVTETPQTVTFDALHDTDGGVFKNTGEEYIMLKNADAEDAGTITIPAQIPELEVKDIGKVTKSDITVALPAGAIKMVGPLPRKIFSNADGNVELNVSGVAAASLEAYVFTKA